MTALPRSTTRPGKVALAGAGAVLWPRLQDTAGAARHAVDSTVEKNILPDPVVTLIQFIFQQPPWVMWGGVVLALAIVVFLLRRFWPRRQHALTWLRTRSRQVKFAMVTGVALVAFIAIGLGYRSYQFVETDRRFCTGCHIFVPSGQVWVQPDSGNYTLVNRLEGKHDSLSCHTCHPLKPMKEAVKLVFWMSGVRDKEIPPHAKVPTTICEQCHVQGKAKETWQAIAATAGHRAHLESDSSAMQGKKECLTCHARTAHRFPPVSETCGQSGCHDQKKTEIVLGKMASQGEFHCTACHVFTATVPLLATRDSAAGTLRPALQQCFKCHAMRERLPDFDDRKDPHNGTCGMCHNPHEQKSPAEARATCTSANCHSDWRKDKFHTGVQHGKIGEKCLTCHAPHAARVDASDCAGCHEAVRGRSGGALRPPLPFDTLKTLRRSSLTPEPAPPERPNKVKGDSPLDDGSPGGDGRTPSPPPSDTFSHPRHKNVACLTCHLSKTGAKLTFTPPRGCQICHHEAPARSDCSKCHQRDSLPASIAHQVSIAAAGKPARERTIAFQHEPHADVACTACHATPVTLTPVDSAATCQGCHEKHHDAKRECAACHRTPAITPPHQLPARTHVACDACHATTAIAPLSPTRNFCLTCHGTDVDHYPARQCSECHLRAHPDEYRPKLLKGTAG